MLFMLIIILMFLLVLVVLEVISMTSTSNCAFRITNRGLVVVPESVSVSVSV